MKTARKILIFLLLICLLGGTAFADSTIDYDRDGAVTITLLDIWVQRPAPGVKVCLYRVADMDGDDWVFTRDFRRCGLSLDDLREDRLAERLADYAAEHDLDYLVDKTDRYGEAVFTDLPFGLYLAVQKEDTYWYLSFEPFLICVPMTSEDGREWVYHVKAYPKVTPRPNRMDDPADPGRPPLIQTGLLKWPVPVLAALGTLLFAIGWSLVYLKDKKSERG